MDASKIWQFPIKEFHPFPRGLIGPGAYEMVGVEAKKLGFKRTLLMTSGMRGTDLVDDVAGKIRYQGIDVVIYDKVESNPKDYNCMDAADLYRREHCDSIVSVGGGSVTDAAKGARLVIAHDGRNVNEFDGFNRSDPDRQKNPPAYCDQHHCRYWIGDQLGVRDHRYDRAGCAAQVAWLRR